MSEAFVALDSEYRFTYVNSAAERIYGRTRESLLGRNAWEMFPETRNTEAAERYERAMTTRVPTRFETFFEPWEKWFEVNVDPTVDGGLALFFRDITERTRGETILKGQKRALELAVNGAPLQEVLTVIVRTIEEHATRGVSASILLLDPDGIHLRHGAAPHLPEEWNRAIDGAAIGPAAGSCGTAAYTRQRVIVNDIMTDPRWADYRELAAPFGFRACWSTPIISARGTVLGTFALYHHAEFTPPPADFEVIDLLTHTAAVVIERHRETEEREKAEQRLALQVDGLEKLHAMATRIAEMRELPEKLEAILEAMTQIHQTSRGLLAVCDKEQKGLRVAARRGVDESIANALTGLTPGPDAGAAPRALFQRKRVVVEDTETDPAFTRLRDYARAAGIRAVHSTPLLTRTGEILGVISIHFGEPRRPTELEMRLADLCARHASDAMQAAHAEIALRESESKFRHLADNMSQMAWMADENGSILWFNRRWYDYTGTPIGEEWSTVHPDHVDRVDRHFRSCFERGEVWEDTVPVRGKDGTYRWFLSRAIPLRDAGGRITRWFGTNTDITEVREKEAELQQAKEQAEEANRAKDQFLAMLAHELRNPLAPIVTALELANMRGADPTGERALMERQVGHLVRLVEDLLDMARFTRGKVQLRRERLQMTEIVTRAMEMAQPLILEKQHHVDVDVQNDLFVDGDPVRLAQIASNLIGNAAKYTDPGGHIQVRCAVEDGNVVLRVRDNGMGLTPEMRSQVFDAFVQEKDALKQARGGLGLGLSIVRSLVDLHGGSVEAHSEGRGKGSEFVVRLPSAQRDAKPATIVVEAAPRAVATDIRVLIVDDNEDAAVLLSHTLKRMGYTVAIAHDGEAGLRAAERFHPDVALLDIALPIMNGYELGKRIRETPGLESVRLVAATGSSNEAGEDRTRTAGFDAHLVKPISIRTLSRTLDEIMSRDAKRAVSPDQRPAG